MDIENWSLVIGDRAKHVPEEERESDPGVTAGVRARSSPHPRDEIAFDDNTRLAGQLKFDVAAHAILGERVEAQEQGVIALLHQVFGPAVFVPQNGYLRDGPPGFGKDVDGLPAERAVIASQRGHRDFCADSGIHALAQCQPAGFERRRITEKRVRPDFSGDGVWRHVQLGFDFRGGDVGLWVSGSNTFGSIGTGRRDPGDREWGGLRGSCMSRGRNPGEAEHDEPDPPKDPE